MPRKIVRISGPVSTCGVRRAVDAVDVLQRHGLDDVDLARQQRRDAGRVVGDRREDDLVDVAFDLAPVVRVLLEDGRHAGLVALDREGAGAHRVQRGVGRASWRRPGVGATELFFSAQAFDMMYQLSHW